MNPSPPKEPSKEAAATSKEPVKDLIEIVCQSTSPSENPVPVKSAPSAKDPLKSDDEHISLGSEPGADSDKGAIETSSSVGTPEKTPRGRKLERKKRDEKSYMDVIAGV